MAEPSPLPPLTRLLKVAEWLEGLNDVRAAELREVHAELVHAELLAEENAALRAERDEALTVMRIENGARAIAQAENARLRAALEELSHAVKNGGRYTADRTWEQVHTVNARAIAALAGDDTEHTEGASRG